jgi:hypothetical protein
MRRTVGLLSVVLLVSTIATNYCYGQRGIPAHPPAHEPQPSPVHPTPVHPVVPHGGQDGSDSSFNPGGVICLVLACVGVVVAVVGAFALIKRTACQNRQPSKEPSFADLLSASNRQTVAHLRIVRTPPGEAPEEIRRAWVGVELPLYPGETEPSHFQTVGVLSQRGALADMGYAVDGPTAVDTLEFQSPEAAAWWRENAPR